MKISIDSVDALGDAVWAVRKARRLRQDDAAGAAGVSHVFVRDVERGKPTVQFGRVLQLLSELGIEVLIDLPEGTEQAYLQCRQARLPPEYHGSHEYRTRQGAPDGGPAAEVRDEPGARDSDDAFFRTAFEKNRP